MTTINAGTNIILGFIVKDEAGVIVPTAEIASFKVELIYQPEGCAVCHENAASCVTLGEWTFTAPDVFSDGMRTTGDGLFEIELTPEQTITAGLVAAKTTTHFIDSDYFITGSQVDVVISEDVLEIIGSICPVATETEEGLDLIIDDDGTYIMDDNGDLLAA